MLNFLQDILAPKKCYSCGQEWRFLCLECLQSMSSFEDICYVCKEKTIDFTLHNKCRQWVYFDGVIICTHYSNRHISFLIKKAKFYGMRGALEDLAFYMSDSLKNHHTFSIDDIIIWVAMTFFKTLKRGYNQSEFIAKIVGKKCNIPYQKSLLKKKNHTRQQSHLSRQERKENIKNCFQINKKYRDIIDKKNIIVVDDVISTGATMNEVAKVLKQNGANKVIWLCFASD